MGRGPDDDAVVWLDGRLVPVAEAAVSPFDHGMTVGDGVFETIQVVRGTPFAARRHLGRLRRSAAGLGLVVPVDDGELRRALRAVVAANRVERGRLRLTVTGGSGPLGSDRGDATPTVVVATGPLPAWERSTGVVTVPWPRNEHSAVAGLKTTSYAENVVALAEARRRGAHEALFGNTRGELCEGTGSNVFVALGDALVTPPLTSGCLAGITRELLLEWAAKDGLPVEERAVPLWVLGTVQDVVLTSSTRDVQPVATVDGRHLGGGELGKAAAELFARRAAVGIDP